ncbi:MAG TPA: cytochrome c biogenesis protein ResB, partial [Humibacillus sp.]|nr:cytochrome c biogenesis protein ResB [Humibacillus sp.]
TDEMTQVTKADGSPALIRLKPGQTYEIPGGRGTVTFDSVKRFAGLSVRTDPGAPISLVSAILATLGLILGLTIKRRRVFVRVRPSAPGAAGLDSPSGDDGRPATVVTIGGLSKDSDAGLAAIIAAVHDRLAERNDRS